MKIQIASDLHLELRTPAYLERVITAAPEADLLILAGDISSGVHAIECFKDWPVPVLYVGGNHEYYGHFWHETRADLRRAAEGTCVKFLDNELVKIDGIRFLGTTLWTDFRQRGMLQSQSMNEVQRRLNDYRLIKTEKGPLRAKDTLADHMLSRAWLGRELAIEWPGKTVVITHHGPHPLSIHRRFIGDRANGGFVSDLTDLLRGADLWLHGHTHDSFDYSVAGCRVVTNPAGYQSLMNGLENKSFNPSLVIEI